MKHAVFFILFVLFGGTLAFGQHSSNAYRSLADSYTATIIINTLPTIMRRPLRKPKAQATLCYSSGSATIR